MRSIVSGGTGFIGRALVKSLISKGWEVFVLTRTRGKATGIFGREVEELLPEDGFPRAEYLFNLAGAVKGKTYDDFHRANVKLTGKILEKSRGKVRRVIHLSSQAATGPSTDCKPVSEEQARPVSLYGKSKLEGEKLVKEFPGEWVILRPPAVFGEEDYAFMDLYKVIKKGFAPWLGPRKFSMIYVKDLVYAMEAATERGEGEVLHVASYEEVDYWEFVMEIAKILGRDKVRKLPISLPLARVAAYLSEIFSSSMFTVDKIRELRYPCWLIDTSKAEKMGLLRRTPLPEALSKTLSWAQSSGLL